MVGICWQLCLNWALGASEYETLSCKVQKNKLKSKYLLQFTQPSELSSQSLAKFAKLIFRATTTSATNNLVVSTSTCQSLFFSNFKVGWWFLWCCFLFCSVHRWLVLQEVCFQLQTKLANNYRFVSTQDSTYLPNSNPNVGTLAVVLLIFFQ